MSVQEVNQVLGFDLVTVVHAAKRVSGTGQRVRVEFMESDDSAQAHSYHDEAGTCVISLPKREVIMRKKGLDETGTTAKYKSAICEEVAHCSEHETEHNNRVVTKTLMCMNEVLTEEESHHPYILEKRKRLERSPERLASLTPL